MKNIKETIKICVLLFFVAFFAIIVTSTKGKDPLKLDFSMDWEVKVKDEFSYPIVNSEYNGEYKNSKGNSMYTLVGKNSDGTYRIYFLRNSTPILKLDNAQLKGDEIFFIDNNNVKLKLRFTNNALVVDEDLSLGNAQLEGEYKKMKNINSFSSKEIEIYK